MKHIKTGIEENAVAEYGTESVASGSCSVLIFLMMKAYVGLPPKPA